MKDLSSKRVARGVTNHYLVRRCRRVSPLFPSGGGLDTACRFPFGDSDGVRQWAEEYFRIIPPRVREEEHAFALEMPPYRADQILTKDMFVRLARWKSPRKTPEYLANGAREVERVSHIAFTASSLEAAIAALVELRGVALRTATALLHWIRSDCPILDFRVVGVLELAQPKNWKSVAHFRFVTDLIRRRAAEAGVDLRTIDRAMWAWHKVRANRHRLASRESQ